MQPLPPVPILYVTLYFHCLTFLGSLEKDAPFRQAIKDEIKRKTGSKCKYGLSLRLIVYTSFSCLTSISLSDTKTSIFSPIQ